MGDIDFLSLPDVLLAHADQIARYGGDPSVRHMGLPESAIAQPRATFGGAFLHDFPFEMAAAYLFHIVQNHPFVDGNKRSGAVAALLFLELNSIEIIVPAGSIYEQTIAVANGLAGKFHQDGMTSGLHRRFQIRRSRESILDVVVESLEDVRGCDPEQHGRYPAKTIGQILYWRKPCELIDVATH